ncbi:predicted protein [Chaetoceros tenuissimus]|uniref:Uncharacterized protein n=1 Tax=Chaetoceros tenuissimus TaxID=426638 RepID=A0AAD3H2L0_9STRA|nr:predicted protein [Chaetoceros tenuissimus]
MKFSSVLLTALAAFSPVVHSQSSRSWRLWTIPSETERGWVWDVSYIQFFPSEDFTGAAFPNDGDAIHSGSLNLSNWKPENAFLPAQNQVWGGRQSNTNEFYIGMTFSSAKNVGCVKLDQYIQINIANKVWVQALNENTCLWEDIYVGLDLTLKNNVINTEVIMSPSMVPLESPSSIPSMVPSESPSSIPSSEPSWEDDEQCKKKDSENDICEELDGRCKIDCEDDENFVCVPGLCSYDRNWDKPTKSPKMRKLMDEVDVVDVEIPLLW